MTCPHCGATAREHERFCPSCSRLVNSPLLKMRQELDAARGGAPRDRAPRAAQVPAPGLQLATSAAESKARAERARLKLEKRARNAQRKAERRAPVAAAARPALAAPLPIPREVHARSAHDMVPDGTLEAALRGQGAESAAAIDRARQPPPGPAQPPTPPRPPKSRKPRPGAAKPAVASDQGAAQDQSKARPRRLTPAVAVLLLGNLVTLATLYAGVHALDGLPEGTIGRGIAEPARVLAYLVGGLTALASIGLWSLQPFGRALQRLLSALWLPVFPFGTLFAFVAIAYLGSRGVRLLFSERGGGGSSATEDQLLANTRKFAPLMALVFLVLGGAAWAVLVGLAATVGPALKEPGSLADLVGRATSGTPAEPADPLEAVLTDLETFAAAQAAYATANAGFYDRTECLVSKTCIPGAPALAVDLDARFLEPVRHGYEFRLRLDAPPQPRPPQVSPTSVTFYTYLALSTADSGGTWGYCVDPTLSVCRFDASVPVASPPRECPAGCEFVR